MDKRCIGRKYNGLTFDTSNLFFRKMWDNPFWISMPVYTYLYYKIQFPRFIVNQLRNVTVEIQQVDV